jgi:hypothetical protein
VTGARRVSVDELELLHLRHLQAGPAGIAAALRALAGDRRVSVAEIVAEIARAARAGPPELAGWAGVVLPFVQAAVEAGATQLGDQPSQSTRSPGAGS